MTEYLIVGLDDGIILDMKRCVFFNAEELGEADKRLLDFGTETEAISVANREGENLFEVLQRSAFGTLNYGNTIAMTPEVLKEEFASLVSFLESSEHPWENDEEKTLLRTMATWAMNLPDEELYIIAYHAMESDDLWSVWRTQIMDGMMAYYAYTHEEKE